MLIEEAKTRQCRVGGRDALGEFEVCCGPLCGHWKAAGKSRKIISGPDEAIEYHSTELVETGYCGLIQ